MLICGTQLAIFIKLHCGSKISNFNFDPTAFNLLCCNTVSTSLVECLNAIGI